MFNDLKNDLTGAANSVGNAISTGYHDVAGDFGNAIHSLGQGLGFAPNSSPSQPAQASQPAQPPQQAPMIHVAQPTSPNINIQQPNQNLNQSTAPTPTNPMGNTGPQQVGTLRVGPAQQDVLTGLKTQQQNVNAVKVQQPQQQSKPVGSFASSIGKGLFGMTGIPATYDALRLGAGELTGNQKATDNATVALSNSLPQALPIAAAEGIKSGAQQLVGAAMSPYAENVANQQAQYAQHVLNNNTGDRAHDAAVDAYASSIKGANYNQELANQGWTPQTSTWTMGRQAVGAQAGLVTSLLGGGAVSEALDPATAFASSIKMGAGFGATAGLSGALQQQNPLTFNDVASSTLTGAATGALAGGALHVAGQLPDVASKFADTATTFKQGLSPRPYSNLNPEEIQAAGRIQQQRMGYGDIANVQPGDNWLYNQVQGKLGVGANDHGAVDQMLADVKQHEVNQQQMQQMLGGAKDAVTQFAQDHPIGLTSGAVDEAGNRLGLDNQPLRRSEQTGLALSKPTPEPFSDEDIANMNEQLAKEEAARALQPHDEVTQQLTGDNRPTMLSRADRQSVIDNNANQETNTNLELKAKDIHPAIAEVEGHMAEDRALSDQALRAANELSKADQAKLSDALNGEKVGQVDNADRFEKAQTLGSRAYDNRLALDRLRGGTTFRRNNGNYANLAFKITKEEADKEGIPESDRIIKNGKTIGYHYQASKYKSYADAARQTGGKLERLNSSTVDDMKSYFDGGRTSIRDDLLRTQFERLAPDKVDLDRNVLQKGENRLKPAAGGALPFNVDSSIDKLLGNYKSAWEPNSAAAKLGVKAFEKTNALSKAIQFFGTPFHYVNETESFIGKNLLNPRNVPIGVSRMLRSATTREGYDNIVEGARQRGTLPGVRAMGVELHDGNKLERATSAYALTQAESELRRGVDPYSTEGRAVGASINKLVGRKNDAVEGSNPTRVKLMRGAADAPRWTPSQLSLLKDSINPLNLASKEGRQQMRFGAGAVIGKRAVGAGVAIGGGAALAHIQHRKQTGEDYLNEAGLTAKNPVPNIQIGSKNAKGESQELVLPTDQAGLAAGLVTNPGHFLQSRETPVLGFATKLVTNQNWNGAKLSNPNLPLSQQIGTRVKNAALNSFVPIGAQNVTNLQKSMTNPNIQQGIGQDFGLRLKTNPNDPQAVSQQNYFNQQSQYQKDIQTGNFGAINPALAGMDKNSAAFWASQFKAYQALNPGKDMNGVQNSSQWNALSSQQKDSFLLMNNPKGGGQTLSPIFYINQQQAQADPSRPHSPIYDLKGNDGVGFTLDAQGNVTGTTAQPEAQTALDYQNSADPTQKSLVLAANPWLSDYEQKVGNYSQNYKPIMTQYMQGQGWNQSAINQYWTDHPNAPPVIQSAVTPDQQNLMNQYQNITDPTAKSDFFNSNAAELSAAFTAAAIYSGKDAVAKGGLPQQQYPNPTPDVATLLAQMQKNPTHDKGISTANSQLIKNNPQLNQYLADTGIYSLAKDAGRYQYQDPSHPGMSAAQLLNLGRPIDQSTLKSVTDVGKYDIGYNKNAPAGSQYQFMGANGNTAGFGVGYGAGGASGPSSKRLPFVANPRIKKAYKSRPARAPKVRRAHKVYVRGTGQSNQTSVSVKKGSNVLKPVRLGA